MKQNIKILFFGTPTVAASVLTELIAADFDVIGVVTRRDSAKGRGANVSASPTATSARKHNIPVYQPGNSAEIVKVVEATKPDLAVVVAFGMIFTQEILDIPKYGFINLHYSLLPQYRGAAPYVDSILNGDTETGVTITRTELGLDEGDIIAQTLVPLRGDENTPNLLDKLTKIGAELLVVTIPKWVSGQITAKKQTGEPSYTYQIKKEDGHIDWKNSAARIERMVRAYTPWPGSYTFADDKRVKILRSRRIPGLRPGMTNVGVLIFENGHIYVGTGDGTLEILELQPEGKKPMSAHDFINGNMQLSGIELK